MSEQRHPWLTSPLRSRLGTLKLAGSLRDTPGIHPGDMRVLGSYALVLITSGSGYYGDANGLRSSIKSGDAILVFPELAHAYGPDPSESWSQSYVVFEGPAFDLLREQDILSPANPLWHLEPVEQWHRRIEELFQGPSGGGNASSLQSVGRFLSLLTDMAAAHQQASRGEAQAWLDESMRLLSEPQGAGWLNPQEVAPRVGLSYENFRKLFAKETGEAPGQFQKRRRVEHACAAIYQNAASFKRLADELGFCDVYHFSRVFRQVTGETPSAYRKRVRG